MVTKTAVVLSLILVLSAFANIFFWNSFFSDASGVDINWAFRMAKLSVLQMETLLAIFIQWIGGTADRILSSHLSLFYRTCRKGLRRTS